MCPFKIEEDPREKLKGALKAITSSWPNSLLVEVYTKDQSERMKKETEVLKEEWRCKEHGFLMEGKR